ncbi:nucleotidyl transferase AbiEii/AbiGii toxin family protein [Deinococcus planocerae]|uniref:nucleotidyl transferase AbiEii/AbiGii toxin family protein n=1 Tax=Deinococcus planocerae TaxID=1737569 RepID=UPI000C7EB58C|nr:nucleotidyl transferase AbiEii/AbiGii toxin family protein [Deinococcus planocerae]
MRFATAASFRISLDTRLLDRARREGKDVNRLRTQVAFERFLMQGDWVLKGGYALEVRLHDRARSTLDLDLNAGTASSLLGALQDAVRLPVGDHFDFAVRAQGPGLVGPPEGGQRFHVEARLAGRPFARFHVDLGQGDVLTQPPEWTKGQTDLSFADLPRSRLRVYPLACHFAEKVHAYPWPRERQTRVKDLVDLALLLTLDVPSSAETWAAVESTFAQYATPPLPETWPPAPADWAERFQELAGSAGLEPPDLAPWEKRLTAFWRQLRSPG